MSRGSRVRSPPGVPLGACSVMVIIDASQALDPGSIPGRRSRRTFVFVVATREKKKKMDAQLRVSANVRPCSSVGRASD